MFFSHILGISSSELTITDELIFFRGVAKNHQPVAPGERSGGAGDSLKLFLVLLSRSRYGEFSGKKGGKIWGKSMVYQSKW